MIRLLIWLGGAVLILVLFDLIARRIVARRGECGLVRAIILQDSCQGGCPGGGRCVALETRPHWLFGTQAKSCGCMEKRLGGTPTEPPSFAALPKEDGGGEDDPAPAPSPEGEREDA